MQSCNISFPADRFKDVFFERIVQMAAEVDKEKCTGCESCVGECPSEAISMAEEKAVISADACVDCGVCVDACPAEAISM
ncbi:MAG: indolepyruvate ferredoxin oxidoreductase subunit alpha, partial [Planctomycetota bacterium]